MLHRMIPGLAAVAALFVSVSAAEAQQETKGTVSGVGIATLLLQPKVLRVHVDLIGRGKDLKTAMANLRDRREAAKLQLIALKADARSINIGPPSRPAEAGQQEQQMRAMILERTRHHGGTAPTLPTVVSVTAPLTAEWPLAAGDADARLIAAGELQEKITAADLAGTKDKQTLSPEQQEVADELAQMSSQYSAQQGGRSEPQFIYVADVSDQQVDQAMAEAFAKAKQQAARVAKAAGSGLGSIQSVAASAGEMNPSDEEGGSRSGFYQYRMAMLQMQAQMQREPTPKNPEGEVAFGSDPSHLTYRVAVNCTFGLK